MHSIPIPNSIQVVTAHSDVRLQIHSMRPTVITGAPTVRPRSHRQEVTGLVDRSARLWTDPDADAVTDEFVPSSCFNSDM